MIYVVRPRRYYAKRCFLALAETLSKHMIMLQDVTFHDILSFLDAADQNGKGILTVITQGPDQEARIRVPGNDRRAALASGQQTLAAVEQELASYLLRSLRMTFVAALDEHRPDLLLKEVDVFDIRIPG